MTGSTTRRHVWRCWSAISICVAGLTADALWADARPPRGQFEQHEIMIGEVVREYSVYTPAGLPATSRPAILAFHGFASDPSGLRWLIQPDAAADEHGFLLIYPRAVDGSFNAGRGAGSRNRASDDLSFVEQLVAALPERHGVDASRIYAMGFSNGAQLAALFACRNAEKLAGLAMVAHTLNIEDCSSSVAIPALIIHGAKDPMVPFEGGGRHGVASHRETVDFFREMNETGEEHRKIVDRPTVRCRSYDQGRAGVISCVAFDGGHSWPGGRELMVDTLGQVNRELDATSFVMRFFARQARAAASSDDDLGSGREGEHVPLLRRSLLPVVEEADGTMGRGGVGGEW